MRDHRVRGGPADRAQEGSPIPPAAVIVGLVVLAIPVHGRGVAAVPVAAGGRAPVRPAGPPAHPRVGPDRANRARCPMARSRWCPLVVAVGTLFGEPPGVSAWATVVLLACVVGAVSGHRVCPTAGVVLHRVRQTVGAWCWSACSASGQGGPAVAVPDPARTGRPAPRRRPHDHYGGVGLYALHRSRGQETWVAPARAIPPSADSQPITRPPPELTDKPGRSLPAGGPETLRDRLCSVSLRWLTAGNRTGRLWSPCSKECRPGSR